MYQAGDIILVKNNTFLGSIVSWATNCKYSHVGVFVSNKNVVEATLKGVCLSHILKFKGLKNRKKCEYDVYRINGLTNSQVAKITNFVREEVGYKYDFWQLVCMLLFYVFRVTRRIEPIDIKDEWTCSELVAEAFFSAGIRFSQMIDPDDIEPVDIYKSGILEKVEAV